MLTTGDKMVREIADALLDKMDSSISSRSNICADLNDYRFPWLCSYYYRY
jgi:hypothetical protein